MPWALSCVAALLASVWIPAIGESVAYVIISLTFAPISIFRALPYLSSDSIQGPIGVAEIAPVDSPLRALALYWREIGDPIMVWLAILAVLACWIVWRKPTQRNARGLVNAQILVAGCPVCLWTAMAVSAHQQ